MLPLSIAGEKPEPAVARGAARADGPRRPAHAPPVRALRRPAAARRDRARARLAADDPLRRRADRQPRLEDGRRDPRPAPRTRSTTYGQTTVMVTHEAARGRDRRPHPLPRRRPDRAGAAAARRRRGARGDEHARLVIGVALKGLLGRKLRAVADGGGDRARRRDDQRHLRPHRHDQGGVQHRLHAGLQEHRRRHHRQERDRRQREQRRHAAVAARVAARRACAACPASPSPRAASPTRRSSSTATAR